MMFSKGRSFLRIAVIVIFVVTQFAPNTAWAWGTEGHRIVARIAELRLSPQATAAVAELLGHHKKLSDSSVAMWADQFKNTEAGKHTKPWHFVDIPVLAAGNEAFEPMRDCKQENCVIAQIKRHQQILADSQASKEKRLQALKFLVHLVGDLHQPLHCAERNGDRGGNAQQVLFFGDEMNLHQVWDSGLLKKNLGSGTSLLDYADELDEEVTASQQQHWVGGTIEQWAMEAHKVAVEYAYDLPDEDVPNLGREYLSQCHNVVERQLKKGGVRLAHILNEAFAE